MLATKRSPLEATKSVKSGRLREVLMAGSEVDATRRSMFGDKATRFEVVR